MPTPSWIEELLAALDAGDVDAFCEFLTEDVDFVYASDGTVSGIGNVHAFVSDFVDGVAASDHRVHETLTTPTRAVVRGEVTYERHDGSELTVPFVDIFEMEGDEIDVYQVYVDQDL